MKSYSLSTLRLLATLCFLGQATWAAAPVQNRTHVAQKQSHLADKGAMGKKKKKKMTLSERVARGTIRGIKGAGIVVLVLVWKKGTWLIPGSLFFEALSGAIGGLIGEGILAVGIIGGGIVGIIVALCIGEESEIFAQAKQLNPAATINGLRIAFAITTPVCGILTQALGAFWEWCWGSTADEKHAKTG